MIALPADSCGVESLPEVSELAENQRQSGFTIYLDGHEGHRGNVLAHAFIGKVHRLILVLNKLERAFVVSGVRQTDFEIVDADKVNPTFLALKPVPRIKSYNPAPALDWSLRQIEAVGRGQEPDDRVGSEIAFDLVKLATHESETGYKAFWINGAAEPVRFDEQYRANALKIARGRVEAEAPNRWRVGVSQGAVVGELKKVDDLDADNEFVVVPPVGPAQVVCVFPAALKDEMGKHLFKIVRVTGRLHYGEESPFPYRVEATTIDPMPKRRKSMRELRGIFAERERIPADWDAALDGL
jgi:hypothetical protein